MRILYVNTYYSGGGAEKVARQLYYGMKKKGIETFFLAGRLQKNIPEGIGVIYSDFFGRFVTTLEGTIIPNTLLRTDHARKEIIRIVLDKKIDIVHFHNLHGNYFGISDLQEIKKYCKHIVITLHDMWLMTGCCPHAMNCKEWYLSACEKCDGNAVLQHGKRYAGRLLAYKESNCAGRGIFFVTPSKWLAQCCQQGYLKRENVRVIYNGIDMNEYKAWDKNEVRKKYNLPLNKHIIMFSANGIKNPYKGFTYLLTALQDCLEKEDYALLVVGNRKKDKIDLPYDVYDMGYTTEAKVMNELYASADLFILPSMADVFPFTMLEAMASGTPVLAFTTGGIPEAVTEETGWLVPKGDSNALADKIKTIFDDGDKLANKTEKCRSYIEDKFTEDIMLNNYKMLYDEMIGGQV